MWQQIYNTTNDPQLKNNAASHLRLLKVDIDCREINRIADEYEKQTGQRAAKMNELVQAGLLRGIPKDLEGYPYVLDEHGKAELSLDSPLLEEQVQQKR